MAQILDSFGRSVQNAQMSLEQLRGTIRSLAQGGVGKPTTRNNNTKDHTKILEETRKIFKTYDKNYDKNEAEAKKHADKVIKFMKDFKKNQDNAKKIQKVKKKPESSKAESAMAKQLHNLHKHATKKGSLYTHDIHCENVLNSILNALNGTSQGGTPNIGGGGGGGGGGTKPPSGGGGGGGGGGNMRRGAMYGFPMLMDEETESIYIFTRMLNSVQAELTKVEKGLLGLDVVNTIFGDLVDQERQFTQDIRKTAYEVAGVTKESRSLQREFEKIGKTSKLTGKNRTEFEKNYIAMLRKGTKDQKTALNLSISQLNTEEQLGLEAGTLRDTFSEWNHSFRMNTGQIADMGRGMRDVARFTGVTGENLKEAVDNSKEFSKAMRNAATFTVTAGKNLIEISANAQKLGATETLNPILKAMSSTNEFFHNANVQTKSLLVNAAKGVGRLDDLMNGTLLRSKKGIKDMAAGMENSLKMFGVTSAEAIDQLSDDAKMKLNLQVKAAFGVELGEFRQAIQALKESGKGMAERLEDINVKLKQNLTLDEKSALLEEQRRLKASKSLEIITAIDEAAKGAQSMDQALSKFGERRKDFEEDMKAMGQTWTSESDVARKAIDNALGSVNAGLKKSGKSELKIDSSEIEKALKDPTALRELSAKLTKAEQEAATAQKAQLDPLSSMKQSLTEINDNVRQISQGLIGSFLNSFLAKMTILLTVLATIAQKSMFKGAEMYLYKSSINSFMAEAKQRWFGKKEKEGGGGGGGSGAISSQVESKAVAAATAAATNQTGGGKNCDLCVGIKKMIHYLKKIAGGTNNQGATQKNTGGGGGGISGNLPQASGMKFDFSKVKGFKKDMGEAAKALLIIGPAIILLGTAVVWLSKMVLRAFKMDMGTVIETATTVAAVVGAGGAITYAAAEAMEVLQEKGKAVKEFLKNPGPSLKLIAQGALALLILGPALVLLGIAVIKLCQGIMKVFGLDSTTIAKVAMDIGTLLLAVGLIAAAVLGSTAALFGLGLLADKYFYILPVMLLGAAALLMLTPAIVGLAAAVIAISRGVMSLFGVDAKSASEVAANVGGIIFAAGQIAMAVIIGMAGLTYLGILSNFIPVILPWMIMGAAALGLMTFAIISLAQTILDMANAVTTMDSAKVENVVNNVKTLIWGAGSIAFAVISGMAGLTSLGLLAVLGPTLMPWMIMGAAALMTMAPAMLLLGQAVMTIASQAVGMDAKTTENGVGSVKAILQGAGDIAWACIESAAGLALLGLAVTSGVLWLAAAFMPAGAIGLMAMVPAMSLLATAVLLLAKNSSFGMPAKEAKEIAENVGAVFKAAGDVSNMVVDQVENLVLLGLAAVLAPLIIPAMWAGAAFLMMITAPIAALAIGMINLGKMIVSAAGGTKEAKNTVEGIKTIADMVTAVGSIMEVLMEKIVPMTTTSWYNFWGSSDIGNIKKAIPKFQQSFGDVIAFVKEGIVIPVSRLQTDTKGLGKTIRAAKGIAELLSVIGSVMTILVDKIAPMTKVSWYNFWSKSDIGKLREALPKFQKSFESVILFVRDGIIKPIQSTVKDVAQVKEAAQIARGLAGAVAATGVMMDVLSKVVLGMTEQPGFLIFTTGDSKLQKLEKAKEPFRKSFASIVNFIKYGIIDPINAAFPDIKGVQGTLTIAKTITTLMVEVMNMMNVLSTGLMPLAADDKAEWWQFWKSDKPSKLQKIEELIPTFSASFGAIARFVKFGIVAPLQGFEIKGLAQAAKTIGLMTKIITNIPPMMKSLDEAMKLMSPGDYFNLDFPMDRIIKAIPWFTKWFRAISMFIRDGIVNPVVNELGMNLKELLMAARILRAMATIVKSIAGIMVNLDQAFATVNIEGEGFKNFTAMVESGKLQGLMQSLGAFGKATKLNSNIQVAATASPQTNANVEQKVQQDRASAQAGGNVSPELSDIASNGRQEVSLQQQMVTLLQALVSYLKPGSTAGDSSSSAGDTQTNYVVTSPPKYYKWTTGKHNQTAGKAVLNIGANS